MCGRYAITLPPEAMKQLFVARYEGPAWGPRYNVAPSQSIPIVRPDAAGGREIALVRWGLHPIWMKEPPGAKSMINARCETAAEKPFFRDALKRRRCLVPADGYYEWKREGAAKMPHFIRAADGAPLVLAGLWERWRDHAGGEPIETAAILTSSAAASIAHLHDRTPVLLRPESWDAWLDPRSPKETVGFLMEAAIAQPPALEAWPVSRAVNSPVNDGPELIARA
jgi:putative SOS response-associated peptidase YedK